MQESADSRVGSKGQPSARAMLVPLALAQFIASFAGSNMNVAISDIAEEIGTTVSGVQTAITLFLLTMAALMIPGSKLTDIWGRKRCFMLGLAIYGVGALLAGLANGLGVLIIGYSLLQGVGSALMIPPIYILTTVLFDDIRSRAKAFGTISGMGGIGAAAGPLIGGVITTGISWRASFFLQVAVVASIMYLGRRIQDPGVQGEKPAFDFVGAVLSAAGLLLIVVGILQAGEYGWFTARADWGPGDTVIIAEGSISPVWPLLGIGLVFLYWFFRHLRSRERSGREPLLATRVLRNRVSNLGLVTQNVQWFLLLGTSFVVSVFLQEIGGYTAIETGLIMTPATIGILVASALAGRMARRRSQRWLIRTGFVLAFAGMALLLLLVREDSGVLSFAPGLFLFGAGAGIMLTASVNVVQSAFPEEDQGEISGLSRSVSNLGSSLGTAIAGSVLVSELATGGRSFALALIALLVVGLGGLYAALRLPADTTGAVEAGPTAGE